MRERQAGEIIKLHMLALVLALVLTWYALNPAPGSMQRLERDEETPEEKRREKKSSPSMSLESMSLESMSLESMSPELRGSDDVMRKSRVNREIEDIDDLEWPEVIDFV
jgi:hypothetical protein